MKFYRNAFYVLYCTSGRHFWKLSLTHDNLRVISSSNSRNLLWGISCHYCRYCYSGIGSIERTLSYRSVMTQAETSLRDLVNCGGHWIKLELPTLVCITSLLIWHNKPTSRKGMQAIRFKISFVITRKPQIEGDLVWRYVGTSCPRQTTWLTSALCRRQLFGS